MRLIYVIIVLFLFQIIHAQSTRISATSLLQSGGNSTILVTNADGSIEWMPFNSLKNSINFTLSDAISHGNTANGRISSVFDGVLNKDAINVSQVQTTVSSYSDLIAYDKLLNTISLKTINDNGIFDYLPALPIQVVDFGIVFPATGKNGGYWKRKLTNNIVDVTMFGATLNDNTDDAFAFQAMFNSPLLAENVSVKLSIGIYNVNSRVLVTDKKLLHFDGNYATIKVGLIDNLSPSQGCVFYIGRSGNISYDVSSKVENLFFDFGNQITTCNALFFGNIQKELNIDNVHAFNFGSNAQTGLFLYGVGDDVGGSYGLGSGAKITNCSFKGNSNNGQLDYNNPTQRGRGIIITGNQGSSQETVSEFGFITGCTFWGLHKAVTHIEGANWTFNSNNLVSFCNPIEFGNVDAGIIEVLNNSVSNNGKLTISGNQFKHNQGYCIYSNYNNASRPILVLGNQFISNDYTCIYFENTGLNMIQSNVFQNWKNAFLLNHLNRPFSETLANVPAIRLKNSPTNLISQNLFESGGNFIEAEGCSYNNITNNTFKDGGYGIVLNNCSYFNIADNITYNTIDLIKTLGNSGGGGNTVKRQSNTFEIVSFTSDISATILKEKHKTLFYQVGSTTATNGTIILPSNTIMGESYELIFTGLAATNTVEMTTPYVVATNITFQASQGEIILKNYDENDNIYFGDVFIFTKINPDKWMKSVQRSFNPSFKFLPNAANAETLRFNGTNFVGSDVLRNNGVDLFFKNKVVQGNILSNLETQNSLITSNAYGFGSYRDLDALTAPVATIFSFGAKLGVDPVRTSEIWGITLAGGESGRMSLGVKNSGVFSFSQSLLEDGSIKFDKYNNSNSFSVVGAFLPIFDENGKIGSNGYDYIWKKTEIDTSTILFTNRLKTITERFKFTKTPQAINEPILPIDLVNKNYVDNSFASLNAINNYTATQNYNSIVNFFSAVTVQNPTGNANPTPKSYVDAAIASTAWDLTEQVHSVSANIPSGSVFISNVSGTGATNTLETRVMGDNYARMSCKTGTTVTGRAGITTSSASLLFETGKTYEFYVRRFRIPATLTPSINIYIGFGDGTTTEPVDGSYFKINDLSTNITCVTSSNSTRTNSLAGLFNFAVNTDYDLKIIATSTSIEYYINNMTTPIFTSTTNIPKVSGREFGVMAVIVASAGVVSQSFQFDDIKVRTY